ncbi:uncharacterized protein BO80DRAFT_421861 [Aspergillus ibericus CBS 121593]|uniref:Uncharacterized protein n=1 Tax=Aspergillus ibericus CBS 121593 TaxID=1448316 RepID=A0A395H9F8_9EURO|nr:hypothetical protein BO80DRAFT_421861 [Aspergillus ibericus CBS 121593]RAL04591.1 hypothetical protein BO80DRAFT_421861 [Aspergillus ibericus CBS 121593]
MMYKAADLVVEPSTVGIELIGPSQGLPGFEPLGPLRPYRQGDLQGYLVFSSGEQVGLVRSDLFTAFSPDLPRMNCPEEENYHPTAGQRMLVCRLTSREGLGGETVFLAKFRDNKEPVGDEGHG